MAGNSSITTTPSGNITRTTLGPINTTVTSTLITTASTLSNITTNNVTAPLQAPIFLQTPAAQGIGGAFAFIAIFITCHQVNDSFELVIYCHI